MTSGQDLQSLLLSTGFDLGLYDFCLTGMKVLEVAGTLRKVVDPSKAKGLYPASLVLPPDSRIRFLDWDSTRHDGRGLSLNKLLIEPRLQVRW
jgi:hypothetical protein